MSQVSCAVGNASFIHRYAMLMQITFILFDRISIDHESFIVT